MGIEQHEYRFTGVFIPVEIWLDEELSPTDKLLWALIHSLDGPEGCFASNAYLGKALDRKSRTVSRSIAMLKEKNMIVELASSRRQRVLQTSRKRLPTPKTATLAENGVAATPKTATPLPPSGEVDRDSIRRGGAQGFDVPGKPDNTDTSHAREIATQLKDILDRKRGANRFVPYSTVDTWMKSIKKLLRQGVTPQQVFSILKWYEKHQNDKYTPRVASGANLLGKYDALVEARKRERDERRVVDLSLDVGEYFLKKFTGEHFPEEFNEDMAFLSSCEAWWVRTWDFVQKHRSVKPTTTLARRNRRTAGIIEADIGSIARFGEVYGAYIRKRIASFRGKWNSGTKAFCPEDGKLFVEWFRTWAVEKDFTVIW